MKDGVKSETGRKLESRLMQLAVRVRTRQRVVPNEGVRADVRGLDVEPTRQGDLRAK